MLIISRLDPECIKISAINLLRSPIPSCQHLKKMVGRGGIEPPRSETLDLQSRALPLTRYLPLISGIYELSNYFIW